MLFTSRKYLSRLFDTRGATMGSCSSSRILTNTTGLVWYLCVLIVWNASFFFNILLETSCQYIWFHISLFLTMKHQSMCSSLPALTSPPPGRLLMAVPKKINCFWNAGKPTAPSHEQHRRGRKRQTAKLQFIISIWPYERNTLSWLNYCSWFCQRRPETCPLNPAPLEMSIVIN